MDEDVLTPQLSIVIITKDRGQQVMVLLKALKPVMDACEIIVVEDSKDGTKETIGWVYPEVRVMNGGGVSATHATNLGLDVSLGRYVLFLGDDCLPESNILSLVQRLCLDFAKAEMVGLRFLGDGKHFDHKIASLFLWALAGQTFPDKGLSPGYVDWVQVFAVDKSRTGVRFDEGFNGSGFNAESDFQLRARKAGVRLWYDPQLRVYQQTVTARRKDEEFRLRAKNHNHFVRKHFRYSWMAKQVFFVCYLALAMQVRWRPK